MNLEYNYYHPCVSCFNHTSHDGVVLSHISYKNGRGALINLYDVRTVLIGCYSHVTRVVFLGAVYLITL